MTHEGQGIRLRGHHLVCLQFFNGAGYSPEFVEGLSRVLARAASGEPVLVVSGVDDVCAVCPFQIGNACAYYPGADADIRRMDDRALALLEARISDIVLWESIEARIPLIFSTWREEFCRECDWRATCEGDVRYRALCA